MEPKKSAKPRSNEVKKYHKCPCGFSKEIRGGRVKIGDKAQMPKHSAVDGGNNSQTNLCRNVGSFYYVKDKDGNL